MKQPAGFDFGKVSADEAINIVGPGNLTDMANFTADAAQAGIYTIFDPGQSLPAWDAEGLTNCIRNSDLLIANDYEMALITERTGIDEPGLLGLTDALVTTLGEEGTRITTADGDVHVPCVPTQNVVDPTGAGDAFRGGLIVGLIQKEGLERAAQIGSACAHFVIQQPGTQEYRYSMAELEGVLSQAYGA